MKTPDPADLAAIREANERAQAHIGLQQARKVLTDPDARRAVLEVVPEDPKPQMTGRIFSIHHRERPWHENGQRRMHWGTLSQLVAEWRHAFMVLARAEELPHLDKVTITVIPHYRGGKPCDPGGCYPAAKAAIDGLRDARVIDDDDGRHVLALVFLPPVIGDRDALELLIQEVA